MSLGTTLETVRAILDLGGQSLLHGTVLALLTWLLCATVLRRARPALQAALWTVVLLRFLIPPILPGELALSGWLARSFPVQLAWEERAGAAEFTLEASGTPGRLLGGEADAELGSAGFAAAALPLLFLAYLLALIVVASRSLLGSIRVWTCVGRLPLAGRELLAEVENLSHGLGLRRSPRVCTTSEAVSPFVIGLWRPTLVIPTGLFVQMDAPARKALILHELAHLRRRDHFVRWLQNAARTLLFFWPPVWWVCRRIERFAELACDQWAVSISRISPHHYARSLLAVVSSVAAHPAADQELAFARRGNLLEERFEMILKNNNRMSPRLSWLTLPALAGWVSFALAGGAGTPTRGPQESQEPIPAEHTHKAKVKKIVVRVGDGDFSEAIVEDFPEADLDGDGAVTLKEFKEYMASREGEEGPHAIFIGEPDGETRVITVFAGEPQEVCESDLTAVRTLEGGFARAAERILERHPELDLDGDGQLSKEELKGHLEKEGGRYFFAQTGEPGEKVFVMETLERVEEGKGMHAEHEVFVLAPEGERLKGILERHPDLDRNGDGTLDEAELKDLKTIRGEGPGHPHSGEFHGEDHVFNVRVSAPRITWTSEDGDFFILNGEFSDADLDGDGSVSVDEARAYAESHGGKIEISMESSILVQPPGEEGQGEISEEEALARSEKMAAERRLQLLRKYPEADLNGDGVLSKEEAEALAARLQKDLQKPKEGPSGNKP